MARPPSVPPTAPPIIAPLFDEGPGEGSSLSAGVVSAWDAEVALLGSEVEERLGVDSGVDVTAELDALVDGATPIIVIADGVPTARGLG